MERTIFASRKESDKITLPVWPTTQGFARWRESVLAITVATSGDKAVAAKFVSEVDNPNIELAVFVTNRPDEMISIDSKLYAAILSVLPKGDDGDRIHAAIKGSCASYCGRQAIRILDKDFQYQGPRKQKKNIQTMVTLHLEGGLKRLGSFWTSWIEVRQDLKVRKMNRACERLALYSRTNSKHSARQMYPSELHWTTGALLLLQPKVILSSRKLTKALRTRSNLDVPTNEMAETRKRLHRRSKMKTIKPKTNLITIRTYLTSPRAGAEVTEESERMPRLYLEINMRDIVTSIRCCAEIGDITRKIVSIIHSETNTKGMSL